MYSLFMVASLVLTGDPSFTFVNIHHGSVTNPGLTDLLPHPTLTNLPIRQEPQVVMMIGNDHGLPITDPCFAEVYAKKPEFDPPPWKDLPTPLPLLEHEVNNFRPTMLRQPPHQWWPLQ